jgi:hypothetical protein
MAASADIELVAVVDLQGEAPGGHTVGGVESRYEGKAGAYDEAAKEGRVATVVEAEAAGEAGVEGEAAPASADGGGAREGGRLRWEAEEDLTEEIVIFKRCLHLRRAEAEAEAAHLALLADARCCSLFWKMVRDVVN